MKLEPGKTYICRNGKEIQTEDTDYPFHKVDGLTAMGSSHYIYGRPVLARWGTSRAYWSNGVYAGKSFNTERCPGQSRENEEDPWDVIFPEITEPQWEQVGLFE